MWVTNSKWNAEYSDDNLEKIGMKTAGLLDLKVGWDFASSLLFGVSLCEAASVYFFTNKAIANGLILAVIIRDSDL